MTNVLITGGAGFIGSHIADILLKNNFHVIIVDNLSSGDLQNLAENNCLKFYNCDVLKDDLEKVFISEKPDYVIHLAAQTSVSYSVLNTYEDAMMNILGSIKVTELSKKYNVKKILAASSAAVYGVPQYLPIDEAHPTEPISPYGLSKLTMEKYIKLSGLPYIIFRFSNAYGPRQKSSKESGVIAIFDKAMRINESINIFGDGNQIRDFVYVEDIAKICLKALDSEIKNEIFNFSTNKGETINNVFAIMKEIYKYGLPAEYLPARKGDILESVLSNRKEKEKLGVTPDIDIKSGLQKLKESGF